MPCSGRFNRIGIIGAGQLGQMLILAGRPLGYAFAVLDKSADAPGATIADKSFVGDLYDSDSLSRLISWADVTTFEIEHTNTEVLQRLDREGACIRPSPSLLALINDKLAQKDALASAGIPVPAYSSQHSTSFPTVQKLRHGGYDGRGVVMLNGPEDEMLDGPSLFEEKVDLECELSVIVARRPGGQMQSYAPVDLHFHPEANVQLSASAPSHLSHEIQRDAQELAESAIEALGGVGVHAVELFLSRSGKLLVNEIAPRPHNSGHLTIEACPTSQFEQHLRAITDIALGPTDLLFPAVSVNLLGAPGESGDPDLSPLRELMGYPGAHVHWYHKKEVRPYRKMGHVTFVGDAGSEDTNRLETRVLFEMADSLKELFWIAARA